MDTEETFALTLAQVSRSWRAALDAGGRVSGFYQARW
jgi:hypothetical protein